MAGVFAVLEGAANQLPPRTVNRFWRLSPMRGRLDDLVKHDAKQTRVALATMEVALVLQQQRNTHRENYAALVDALQANDTHHPIVGAFIEAFGQSGNILADLEQALGSDASAIIGDIAQGHVEPDDLDYLIGQLQWLREGQVE